MLSEHLPEALMQPIPAGYLEIFLNPGEHHFGDHETRIRTLLGSCIAVTMWHPVWRLGGMCHFLVPDRGGKLIDDLDGRYGLEAVLLLTRAAVAAGVDPSECRFKVFGGGNMFPGMPAKARRDVGARNIGFVESMLGALGHAIDSHHVGGEGHRNVVFDVWTGDVWLKYQAVNDSEATVHG